MKESPFYIRRKLEYSTIAEDNYGSKFRIFTVILLCINMYGAVAIKYVSGSESFTKGMS